MLAQPRWRYKCYAYKQFIGNEFTVAELDNASGVCVPNAFVWVWQISLISQFNSTLNEFALITDVSEKLITKNSVDFPFEF